MTDKSLLSVLDDTLADPRAVVHRPDTIVDAEPLTDTDKVPVLTRWREDDPTLQRMGTKSTTGDEDDLLQSVDRAIDRVGPAVKGS